MVFKRGFTLMELLIVIAIGATLVTISMVSYTGIQKRSRDLKRKSDLEKIRSALELYRSDIGSYPSTGNVYWGECSGGQTKSRSGANAYIPGLTPNDSTPGAPVYISELPRDPKFGSTFSGTCASQFHFCYLYRSNGASFKFLAACGIEGAISSEDPFYDPKRPTTSFQVSSDNTALQW